MPIDRKMATQDLVRVSSYSPYDKHEQRRPVETLKPPSYNRGKYPPAKQMVLGDDFTLFVHQVRLEKNESVPII